MSTQLRVDADGPGQFGRMRDLVASCKLRVDPSCVLERPHFPVVGW